MSRIRTLRRCIAVLAAAATAAAAHPAARDDVVLERYTRRPGGAAAWFGLHPVTSHVTRAGRGEAAYDAAEGWPEPGIPVPAILMDCKRAEPQRARDAAAWPLAGLLIIRRLPSEPPAVMILGNPLRWLNPRHWGGRPYYRETGRLTWSRGEAGGPLRVDAVEVLRRRWQYSTDSAYRVRLPAAVLLEAFAAPGRVTIDLEAPGYTVRGAYDVGETTMAFMDWCRPTAP